MDDKNAARVLYFEGWKQADIAKTLGKAESTISKWSKQGNWEDAMNKQQLFKQTSVEQVQALIQYQLKVLTLIMRKVDEDVDSKMSIDELKKSLIEKGETDSLIKLLSAVKGTELTWDKMVKLMTEFMKYISDRNLALAQEVSIFCDDYLNEKRQVI